MLEHLNDNAGAYVIILGVMALFLLGWLLSVQQRQLRALEDWEEERQATERQRIALEQARAAMEEAELAARLQREQQVHESRQSVAEASALLHQLKRQFG